ncbi:hypothetical protein OFEAOIEE_LOCUS3287 [Methylorubrum extorquens]
MVAFSLAGLARFYSRGGRASASPLSGAVQSSTTYSGFYGRAHCGRICRVLPTCRASRVASAPYSTYADGQSSCGSAAGDYACSPHRTCFHPRIRIRTTAHPPTNSHAPSCNSSPRMSISASKLASAPARTVSKTVLVSTRTTTSNRSSSRSWQPRRALRYCRKASFRRGANHGRTGPQGIALRSIDRPARGSGGSRVRRAARTRERSRPVRPSGKRRAHDGPACRPPWLDETAFRRVADPMQGSSR